ncbi:hypothetical protein THAOC_20919, partial [Thalassiosira oceanica]
LEYVTPLDFGGLTGLSTSSEDSEAFSSLIADGEKIAAQAIEVVGSNRGLGNVKIEGVAQNTLYTALELIERAGVIAQTEVRLDLGYGVVLIEGAAAVL